MYKNKINYRFLNIIFVLLIIYLLYMTFGLWNGIIQTIIKIISPFFLAFTIAYALYPFAVKLQSKNIPKGISIAIVVATIISIIVLVIWLIIPVMIDQVIALTGWLADLIKSLSADYNVDLSVIQEYVGDLRSLFNSFGNFGVSLINKSINIATLGIIALIAAVYFLSSMDKIRKATKKYLLRKNNRTFEYVNRLDHEVSQYFVGLEKFMLVQFVEYTFIFFIIGHPYYLLLGFLCSITTVIPYFGGIFCNIIACITAFFVSTRLFIFTLIVAFIVPNIDGYIISPRIYGKTNNVPTLLTIFAAYAGGKLFGFIGIVIALPLTIILLATYRFYEDEINKKIVSIKNKNKL